MTSEKLEERLSTLRAEHAKCLQNIANLNTQRTQFEAQALRIEGAITLVGEMLAESAQLESAVKPLASVPHKCWNSSHRSDCDGNSTGDCGKLD